MNLIDTHCHLAHGRLRQELPAVLERAAAAGVGAMICAAGDLAESTTALELAKAHPNIFCLAGVHPHEAKDAPADYLNQLEALAAHPRCVALGEIGLDYHYNFSPPEAQRRVFAEQLALAVRLGKKAVLHTREAFEDTMALVAASGIAGSRLVFHSFTESAEAACRVVELGASVSFSGIVTFARSDALRQAALAVPDERLLVETDAPYLSPEPVRKMKTNEPANVLHVAACLAKLRNVPLEAMAELTTRNALQFSGIKPA